MNAYPAWTPASRPGIVPLHPYGFGTILGRSFVALRHNPKVLLGFALVVQALASIVLTAAIAGVAIASFSRLDTVPAGSDDFDAILTGSIVITAATTLVLGLASGALSVVVQGVVVAEVAHAVVAEKPTLRATWARVKPVFWKLIGYSALVLTATVLAVGLLAGIVALLAIAVVWVGILVGILALIALIPLYLWLTPKLFLVPSVIILERAPVFRAIGRSWALTRGRFWSTLGVVVVISMTFGSSRRSSRSPWAWSPESSGDPRTHGRRFGDRDRQPDRGADHRTVRHPARAVHRPRGPVDLGRARLCGRPHARRGPGSRPAELRRGA